MQQQWEVIAVAIMNIIDQENLYVFSSHYMWIDKRYRGTWISKVFKSYMESQAQEYANQNKRNTTVSSQVLKTNTASIKMNQKLWYTRYDEWEDSAYYQFYKDFEHQ